MAEKAKQGIPEIPEKDYSGNINWQREPELPIEVVQRRVSGGVIIIGPLGQKAYRHSATPTNQAFA